MSREQLNRTAVKDARLKDLLWERGTSPSVRPCGVRCELGAGLPARPAEPRGQQGLSRAGRALCAQEGAG